MIITLAEAKKLHSEITQEDLDGIEVAIRELTNNNFQNRNVRIDQLKFEGTKIVSFEEKIGFVKGKTIQVSNSKYNDGLYTIKTVDADYIEIEGDEPFITATVKQAIATLVEYPADIVAGVRKLIQYDKRMGHKLGIKSETISRWSTSYYDQNSSETVNGYPAAMMAFITKYRKLRF